MWAEVMARCLTLAGVRKGMIVHNAYTYGLFTGGLGVEQGGTLLGATVLPMSSGVSSRQVTVLRDLKVDVLCCTPSYALNLAQMLNEAGVDPGSLALRIGVFGAEPWTEAMRAEIERVLAIKAVNIYGLSEIVGPGISTECIEARSGSHVQEDHFYPEIVDPETGALLPPGKEGELVLTTLTKEAVPMIRFRTGDISTLDEKPCVCGRTLVRMGRVRGRYDDMLIIRGANLYPSEVERILLSVGGVAPHYQIVVERPPSELDTIIVMCEPTASGARDFGLPLRIKKALYDETGISMDVRVAPPGGLPRSEGKAVRVIDKRPKK
jgi:phenylacetate-CoA ligase